MMVGTVIKVSLYVRFLPIDLVGVGVIKKMRDENIQKGDIVVLLDLHSELDVGGRDIKMIDERDKVGLVERLDEKCFIYKSKLTFEF